MSKMSIPIGARLLQTFDGWALYERRPHPAASPLWLGLKLMRSLGSSAKWGARRTYWLNWGPAEGRFARTQDRVRLEQQEPALYAAVVQYLSTARDRGWLLREEGMTEAEIAEELARLATATPRRRR